ncbi:hypothetical protein [Nocardia nova]|uniref:hypothetical protein n=1 Tax=Nocardia nova TaxID=37330 RepID=UPI000CE9D37C|nr:hypothetical protein [Nocardia nova]PPJ24965.1 hypothetical protein C5E41_21395 [Nocardia nova]
MTIPFTPRRIFTALARVRRVPLVVTAAVLVVASAGAATAATISAVCLHHADAIRTAKTEAESAAKTELPAVLSYDFHTVDTDFPKVTDNLSGKFKDDFTHLSTSVIIPAAHKDSITTKAEVVGTSVVDAAADRVSLLMFLNQTTTSTTMPGPRLDGSRVRITMTHSGSRWLISDITPV